MIGRYLSQQSQPRTYTAVLKRLLCILYDYVLRLCDRLPEFSFDFIVGLVLVRNCR